MTIESSNTLRELRKALDFLTDENKRAILEEDAVRVRDLTPMIANLTKNIRIEEERLGVLLTVHEACERFESVKDAVIESVWKHAPAVAPMIVQDTAALLVGSE